MLTISYDDKDLNAAIGTIERTWRAEDANEVKNVVNALSALVLNLEGGTAKYYTVNLINASTRTLTHNFGRYPVINAVDGSGNVCIPSIAHSSLNSVTLVFNPVFTGKVQFT